MQTLQKPQSVLCLNDLTCVGRCSLSLVAPVLASLGIQPCMLPTALLAAHPACIPGPVMLDTKDFFTAALNQLSQNYDKFDCIYTGFLGGVPQLESAKSAFGTWPKALKIVDPVMGDNGKLYSIITKLLAEEMIQLCRMADIITPNVTESAALLDLPIDTLQFTAEEIQARVMALCKICPSPVITGVKLIDGEHICAGFDAKSGTYFTVPCKYTPVYYPGTGDLFASVLCARILHGNNFATAVEFAVHYVENAVSQTYHAGGNAQYGIWLEAILENQLNVN